MQRLKYILLFFAVLALFVWMAPGNHSEAEDAFEYSRLIEQGQGSVLFHPHHLLYLPMQQGVFRLIQGLGYDGRSYYVARAVSMVCGVVSLFLFYLMVCRLQGSAAEPTDRRIPLLATLGLLFSYGFVRYACEVEIYIPAMALALAAIYAALRAEKSIRWMVVSMGFAALAVLMHTINAALALAAIPLVYLLIFKQPKRAVLHGMVTLVLIGAVYGMVQSVWGLFRPPLDAGSEGWLKAGTMGKALVGLGQCVLSANFVFAYESVAEKLQALFPYRLFVEELFAADKMPDWMKGLAPISFGLALVSLMGGAGLLVLGLFRQRIFSRMFWVLLVWLGGTIFPTVMLEPSNPELWILALAPLWALFALGMATLRWSGKAIWFLGLMVCLLGVHNLGVGMGMMRSREGDYNFKKAEWVLQQASAEDVINTSDSFVFTFYLTYWGAAEVRNINTQDWKRGATTYVFGDVFSPSLAIGVRYPEFMKKVASTAMELKPLCRNIWDDQFDGIWIVEAQTDK